MGQLHTIDLVAVGGYLLAELLVECGRDRGVDRRLHHSLRGEDGRVGLVEGTYPLANLLQILGRAQQGGAQTATVEGAWLFGTPDRILSRTIAERFWDDLTRRLDADGLRRAARDP
ncbi:MAG: hypothetical protein ABEN55_14000 [Bradymonadaceae bacterium]